METSPKYRVVSIDILRGIVMVIMALDHTRDFFHATAMTDSPLNLATTTVPLYFTRWITHFCAPTFVFLSGISACLAANHKTPAQAGGFLIKRGLWLILVEIVIITLGLTFNPFYNFIILQVIWAIGCSMILLGLLLRFGSRTLLVLGCLLFFGHNIFDHLQLPDSGVGNVFFKFLFTSQGNVFPISNSYFIGDFYAILPWTGIMFLGFCCGKWFSLEYSPERRKKLLLISGLSLCLLFVVFRYFNIYGDPFPWDKIHFLSFLNINKYPPSLLYCCATIGPGLIILSLLEFATAGWTKIFATYGRVPFFYYVLHFYILHLILVIVFFATSHTTAEIVDKTEPFLFRPSQFGYGLTIVYCIWLSVVASLYLPCKWFYKYKLTHSQWWLKYL